MQRQEILLESGTNEVELLEFFVGKRSFGINVSKIKQIVPYDAKNLTPMVGSPDNVLGTILYQGQAITLIDLHRQLRIEANAQQQQPQIILICEFNDAVTSFLIDGVNLIHRLSWEAIQPVPSTLALHTELLTGVVTIQGRQMLILDFERIVYELMPETLPSLHRDVDSNTNSGHPEMPLILVDDSQTIRAWMDSTLRASNYQHLSFFDNGFDALQAVQLLHVKAQSQRKPLKEFVRILVTDIEMPKMDGLTLCKKIKEDYPEIYVIVLSSLINDQMLHKCQEVRADHCLGKKQMNQLIELINQYTEGSSAVTKSR